MSDKTKEIEKLVADIEAMDIEPLETSRGVGGPKLSAIWEKCKPFIVMFENIMPRKVRTWMEALVLAVDKLAAKDEEEETDEDTASA